MGRINGSFKESFENDVVVHEMGDKIQKESVQKDIHKWILGNKELLLEEYNLASSFITEYKPKNF